MREQATVLVFCSLSCLILPSRGSAFPVISLEALLPKGLALAISEAIDLGRRSSACLAWTTVFLGTRPSVGPAVVSFLLASVVCACGCCRSTYFLGNTGACRALEPAPPSSLSRRSATFGTTRTGVSSVLGPAALPTAVEETIFWSDPWLCLAFHFHLHGLSVAAASSGTLSILRPLASWDDRDELRSVQRRGGALRWVLRWFRRRA